MRPPLTIRHHAADLLARLDAAAAVSEHDRENARRYAVSYGLTRLALAAYRAGMEEAAEYARDHGQDGIAALLLREAPDKAEAYVLPTD